MSSSVSNVIVSCVFVALMGAALWSDATTRRLPNRLTLTVILVGLATRLPLGPDAMIAGLLGALLGVALSLPLFALGAIGGGDVKLVAGAGAFLGPGELFWALLLGAALSLVVAVEEITRRKVAAPVLYRTRDLILYLVTLGRMGQRPRADAGGAVKIPYGVAIAAGAVFAWFVPMTSVLR